MANVTFSNFKNGLDTRRSELTTQPGALLQLQDGHVNEGAEIEKRFAFLNASYVPENALSLEVTGEGYTPGFLGGTVVFGSGALITTSLSRENVAGVVTLNISAAKPIYSWVDGDTINVINLGINANSGFDSYNGNFILTSATYHTGSPNYYSLVYNVTDTTSETVVNDLNGVVGWGVTNVTYPLNYFGSVTVISRSVLAGMVTMVLSAPPVYGVINGNSIAIVGAGYTECVVPLSLLKVNTGYQITFTATANTEQAGDTVYWPGSFSGQVYYQPLVHPAVQDGATFDATYHALTAITASTSFGGQPWVSTTYTDGNTYVFWGQSYVPAFRNGRVLQDSTLTTVARNQFIAKQLQAQLGSFSPTVFFVGPLTLAADGVNYYFDFWSIPNYTYELDVSNTSVNGSITSQLVSQQLDSITAVAATTTFYILSCNTGGQINSVKIKFDGVNWVDVLGVAVPFAGNIEITAFNVAAQINSFSSGNIVSATCTDNGITLTLNPSLGAMQTGLQLQVNISGDVSLDNTGWSISGAWTTGDTITEVQYNSTGSTLVPIFVGSIIFLAGEIGNLPTFCARVASLIRAYCVANSLPYTASAFGAAVFISRTVCDSSIPVGTTNSVITYTTASGTITAVSGLSNQPALSVVISPSSLDPGGRTDNSPYTMSASAIANNGTGPYTYAWSITNLKLYLSASIIISSSATEPTVQITFRGNNGTGIYHGNSSGSLYCTITDSLGLQGFASIPLTMYG